MIRLSVRLAPFFALCIRIHLVDLIKQILIVFLGNLFDTSRKGVDNYLTFIIALMSQYSTNNSTPPFSKDRCAASNILTIVNPLSPLVGGSILSLMESINCLHSDFNGSSHL